MHDATKFSPFEVIYGRESKIPLDLMMKNTAIDLQLTPDLYAEKVKETLSKVFEKVDENRNLRMIKEKIRHQRRVGAANFNVNDLVWYLYETPSNL